jgi:beta-lactamase class A
MKKAKIIISILLILLTGWAFGWYSQIFYAQSQPIRLLQVRENSSVNHLINPLLYVDTPRKSPEFQLIMNKVSKFIEQSKEDGGADSISIYFRTLNNGKWTGVNEDEKYKPASLLKVLAMMVYFIQADYDPNILSEQLYYEPKKQDFQNYKPPHLLSTGYHTINELIKTMIVNSDNDAAVLLANNKKINYFGLFNTLQLSYPQSNTAVDFMSPKDYSVIFRTLYSSTYLSHNSSEKALDLLTKTNFNDGLVAGVPKDTLIAHKFGEYTEGYTNSPTQHELHDCGIIYYPYDPYFLCIMTRGKDFKKLESIIAEISRLTYQEFDLVHKKND